MSENTSTIDPDTFDLDAFINGTGLVTHTIEVCGKPHLMGRIEQLKADLERPAASGVVDDRPMAKDPKVAIARELEQLRAEMMASITTWTIRSQRNGEAEKIRQSLTDAETVVYEEAGRKWTNLDYATWAAQVQAINGNPVTVIGDQLRRLHLGDPTTGAEGLGEYFVRTIVVTANAAARGEGVDVPFSRASSALAGKQ